MAEEGKKISFGFSKCIKKSALINVPPPEEKKVDYIQCLDDKSIKIIGGEEKKDGPLVIPMLGSKTWHDRIINKTDADIFEPKTDEPKVENESLQNVQIKQKPEDGIPNGHATQPMEVTKIKGEPDAKEPLSLEEQAAREIVADLNSDGKDSKANQIFTVPVTNNTDDDLCGKEEATLEDYENIPIEAFGEAMLRGMGWQPGKGIGKNEKIVAPVIPELRPKGMGLGADKTTVQKALGKLKNTKNEQLKLLKGSYVKVTAGKYCERYATVEGFNDNAARVVIKLALGNEVITVNECFVEPVTSSEYLEKSKILNLKTYGEYKDKEKSQKDRPKNEPSPDSDISEDKDNKDKRSEKSKKKSKKKRKSSDDDSSPERKPRRKRSSSHSSDEDQKSKKSKKSKKHKSRDSSSERSSRKNRKKDKEREKSRYKKSDYSDSSERARHKDRRKSRSRSRSRSPKSHKRDRSRSRSPRR